MKIKKEIINKCQVFTPEEYANELLDYAGYKKNLYGKKILENSCGDGKILRIVVERYIKSLIKEEKNLESIKLGLEEDIYGVEIDEIHFKNCINSLNALAKEYKIENVSWNIFNENSLEKKWNIKFDFIVGNPPYIAYRDLNKEMREFLKNKYFSCKKGRFDYCYAFIEEAVDCLNESGVFAYIIPNSIFKNIFGENLRNYILPYVTEIIDFRSKRLFKNALTTTAFLVCNKGKKRDYIKYIDKEENKELELLKKCLEHKKWIFTDELNEKKINTKRFGDYFNAAMGVATLHNKTFVIKNIIKEDQKYIYLINNFKIEKSILKKGASPLGLKKQRREDIIFPYQYKDNGLKKFTEEEIEELFPESLKYLRSQKEILLKRAIDKSIKWFEYGKTQALLHLNTEKLLLSSLVTSEIKTYYLNLDYIPYSGIYIVKKSNISLKKAKEILESEKFLNYIKKIGKNANGKTLKITAKDINNYHF